MVTFPYHINKLLKIFLTRPKICFIFIFIIHRFTNEFNINPNTRGIGLTRSLLSVPVPPEPPVEVPDHERQGRARKVTDPEDYQRKFQIPAPKVAEWKTAYIDGDCTAGSPCLVRGGGCSSISGSIIRLLELHMEEHSEGIVHNRQTKLT